jgi:hypothetical protein
MPDTGGNMMDWRAIRGFILGGNATFSLKSTRSGRHYTYKVQSTKKDKSRNWSRENSDRSRFFVSVMIGPDEFVYIGLLDKFDGSNRYSFYSTQKSRHMKGSPVFDGFAWAWEQLDVLNHWPANTIEFWHEGSCCICGRPLTDPESVERGMGPDCAAKEGM